MQVAYLQQQPPRRLKAGEGRVAEGVLAYSLTGSGGAVETRLFEIEAQGRLASSGGGGERHYFVLQGAGLVAPASGQPTQELKSGALLSLAEDEGFSISNPGDHPLILLYIAPVAAPALPPATPAGRPAAARPGRPPAPDVDAGSGEQPTYRLVFSAQGGRNGGNGSHALYRPAPDGRLEKPQLAAEEYSDATSQADAEYYTLLDALDALAELVYATGGDPADSRVDLVTDSKLILNQLRDGSEPKTPRLTELRDQALDNLANFAAFNITLQTRDNLIKVLGSGTEE